MIFLVTPLEIVNTKLPLEISRLFLYFVLIYSYYFSVCDTVANIPITQGGQGEACYNTTGVHYPAYQVSQNSNMCFSLGKDATPENVRWSLLDPLDPTVGVNYQYLNGDIEFCGSPRSLIIELTCKDDHYNIPDEEPVYETNCVYKFSIDSVYGCPTGTSFFES